MGDEDSGIELPTIDEVGGKGWSLLRMGAASLPVPPSFILGVDFFAPWVNELSATDSWTRLQSAVSEGSDLADPTAQIQTDCSELSLSAAQQPNSTTVYAS